MKYFVSFLICTFLLSISQICSAQDLKDFKKIEVNRYSLKPAKEFKLLRVPASFGSSKLSNATFLDTLKDKKVTSVKLVYTKYRESETFDQEQLNRKRIANLVASDPILFSNPGIKWYLVEQTMEDSLMAKTLFHGFYILYQSKQPQRNYAISDKLLNTNVIKTQAFRVRNFKDTIIRGKEGSQIQIPANCFLDENKRPYKGEVKMEVKEAISMESIILGNMVTMADGNALESGGMIYIDAKTKDGKSLTLDPKKPIEVGVASKEVSKDMQIWEAENNGKFMNWKNPKPMMPMMEMEVKTISREKKATLEENVVQSNVPEVQLETGNKLFNQILQNTQDLNFIDHVSCLSANLKIGYHYTLYKDDKINIMLFRCSGGNTYGKLLMDTTYNIKTFENKKTDLPIPFFKGGEGSTRVQYKNKSLDYQGKFMNDFAAQRELQYKFNFSEIGSWANIDRLANDPRTKLVNFSATLPTNESYKDVSMYLIFKDKKMYIPGFKSNENKGYGFSHGDYEKPKLPVGAEATVLCIAYKNDTPYFALKHITISEKQEILMNPVASTDDAIKKLIADSF